MAEGLESDGPLPRTTAVIRRGIDERLHVGAQVYASVGGRVVADVAFGAARTEPTAPMRPDTLMLWMSAVKPVTAVAVARQWEAGRLDLDDPVARHVPEFAAKGKERITVRHLLTHTAGIRALAGQWEEQSWDEIIAAVCAARPEPGWEPGKKAGYHLATSWYVLGEIVRRLDGRGRPYDRYVREEILGPLGMNDSWLGVLPGQYRAYGGRVGFMHDTQDPGLIRTSHPLDAEDRATTCRPGSNGRGPARELGFLYEMLLGRGERNGRRLLTAQSVEAITAPHRVGMFDHTFRHVMGWGLGFLINSAHYGADTVPYGYGPHASSRTFGHGGSQCATGFADPDHGLAVAVVWNGRPGEQRHDRRLRETLAALYDDLGLTS